MNRKPAFGKRNYLILLLFGLIGQIAWSVENMYFNLFVFDTIAPNLDAVTLMVQLSGIVATVATLFAGTLSDKTGNRRSFISWGYIIWGITVALFGFMSVDATQAVLGTGLSQSVTITLVAVVAGDCIMTLFGSTANDACFNAWVTDNTTSRNRGSIEGILSILPLIAMLIVAGGFGMLVEALGYPLLFLLLGIVISACGVAGLFVVKDSPTLSKKGSLKDIFYGFKPSVIRQNAPLYLALLLVLVYGVACQIFMPYLIIYMKTYLGFSVMEYSIVFGAAIILGAVVNLFLTRLSDRKSKTAMLYLATVIFAAGLLGMYLAKGGAHAAVLVVFGVFGFVMITGYILVSALCGSIVRDNTPEGAVGKLQGVRMVFSVLIPMIVGPLIGNAINKARNIPLVDAGADAMTTQYIPAPEIFLAAALVALLLLALIPVLQHVIRRKAQATAAPSAPLNTDYEVGDVPHAEYPRPQMQRDSYLTLNGTWSLTRLDADGSPSYQGNILVPFSPESALSGVEQGFTLRPDQKLVYRRTFTVAEGFLNAVTLLHFGAVDQICSVTLNGVAVGSHRGGYTPFTLDVTHAVRAGENEITVTVTDVTEANEGARGKQSSHRGSIWYTPQSGIWQSVWMESVTKDFIRDLTITTDAAARTVTVTTQTEALQVAAVYDGENELARKEFVGSVTFACDFALWSPEAPKLYTLVLTTEGGDRVTSYFGVRSYGVGADTQGKPRLLLNGKPYFFNGLLDQGYWSDGLLTPPSDKAMQDEIALMKRMGFNTLRKHIKLEPLRWYYHCDRLGMCVWQDFVNGGGEYKWTHVALLPFLGARHRDDDYAYFARTDADGRKEYLDAMEETVQALKNCTSIALWTPFNEGWGQFDSAAVTERLRALDNTRIIDAVSGWHDQGADKTPLRSLHTYYTPLRVPKDSRPVVLSEYGGYSLNVTGHVYDEQKRFGYKIFDTEDALCAALETLWLKKLKPLIAKGLCAAIYTQVSDVEEEINGLVTYDRRVVKVPVALMQRLNQALAEEAEKIS